MESITYTSHTCPDKAKGIPYNPGNCLDVMKFVGPTPPCPDCNDTAEYEGEYGPVGCNPCNSRLVPFINFEGKRDHIDWGDTIERREDGLHLIRGPEDND